MSIFASPSPPAATVDAKEDASVVKRKVHDAYVQGKREERFRRRGFPTLKILVLLVAAIGVIAVYYALREGSFSGGGAVVDNKLAQVGEQAAPVVQDAKHGAATAAKKSGQALERTGEALEPAPPNAGR